MAYFEKPSKIPNIPVPNGFEIKWDYANGKWQMFPIKGYSTIYLKKDHFVPKKEKSGELFEENKTKVDKKGKKNSNLHKAKAEKNDEFYTTLNDICEELRHYKEFFKGKKVYCPCDKAYNVGRSNFFIYFASVYEDWGIKELICTQYNPNPNEHGIKWVYRGDANHNGYVDESEIATDFLNGDGDFRSDECKEIMKNCDIVVTNPPFSLFREFVGQIMDMEKQFLIIGNQNAITYKEIFPLIKENKIWLGYNTPHNFETPLTKVEDEKKQYEENGKIYQKFGNICWFTNIPHHKRMNDEIHLSSRYTESAYPKYDNYDAIEVSKVEKMPYDYDGVMGVPITFLGKYNPNQFEIIGLMSGAKDENLINGNDGRPKFYIKGKGTYARILIRKKSN